jgi:two-component system, cell cycle sensor histidine kinase and response regulator CckA
VLLSLSPHDPTRDMIQEIRNASGRAGALTGQLLAFSRQQVLEMRTFDLNPLITDSEKMLQRLLGENIHIVSSLGADLRPVRGDPSQLAQVLMNLAVNARDSMAKAGGTITIETCNIDVGGDGTAAHPVVPAGSYALLMFRDTGCGMAPDVASRIFDPFFTTKSVGKGTGLGLSVVHGIVKQCGGHVEVDSEVGIGTAFRVYLPVVPEAVVNSPASSPPISQRGSETVLVVEDNAAVRAFAVIALRQFGYDVAEASGGSAALQLLSTFGGKPDLLITDVVMPGMSGRELAEAVLQKFPALKVLYMSGYTNDAIVRQGVLAAEVQFLHKPFTPGELVRKVRKVLEAA